jgi:serine/threonine protein kinase
MHSILEGLKAIHQIDTFHQDVKIENVLVGEDNAFKLCDFGSCSSRRVNFKQINKSEYAHIK